MNKTHKILFISSWFPNKLEPTNGNFVQRHAEAASLYCSVEVLHAIGDFQQSENYIFDDQSNNEIRTLIVYYKNSKNPIQNFFRRMSAYKKGYRLMATPDIVHANVMTNNLLFAVWLKKRKGIPFVVSEHWSAFLEVNHHKLSRISKFFAKKIAKEAACILPVSKNLLQGLRQLGINAKAEVVGNVVNTRLFSVMEKTEEAPFVFLHISNLVALKNPEKIIRAAVRLRAENENFRLQIGGDGDYQSLETIIRQENATDYIHTFGEIPLEEVANKMKKSNSFVLFSDYENFPCVLLESLSTGTPVIATKVGGIPEIVHPSNGILIERSEEELFQAMKIMLGRNNFDRINLHEEIQEKYSMEKIGKRFANLYDQILNAKNKS